MVYVMDLMAFPTELIESVCLTIGREIRKEGETAFPPIAVIESRCIEAMDAQRKNAQAQKASSELAEWKSQWERERAEDIAKGIPRGEALTELDALTTPKVHRATPRYTPEQEEALARMQERIDVIADSKAVVQ